MYIANGVFGKDVQRNLRIFEGNGFPFAYSPRHAFVGNMSHHFPDISKIPNALPLRWRDVFISKVMNPFGNY